MICFQKDLDKFSDIYEGLVLHDNEFDASKWLQDKIEYEAMLHRVFGKGEINTRLNKIDKRLFEK